MGLTLDDITRLCVLAADSKQAEDIVVLAMGELSSVADRFLICHGRSDRQVKAIAEAIEEELIKNGAKPLAMEGYQTGTWILIDCGDLIVHVFDPEKRQFYDLERLWSKAVPVSLEEIVPAMAQPLLKSSLATSSGLLEEL